MNKQQLEQKIKDMEQELANLRKQLEEEDSGQWVPEHGERYWFLATSWKIMGDSKTTHGEEPLLDKQVKEYGNMFRVHKTEEEAKEWYERFGRCWEALGREEE